MFDRYNSLPDGELLSLPSRNITELVAADRDDRYIGRHDPEASVTTYFSIPYARADRFELARPIDEVEGLSPDAVVNATKHGPACVNFDLPPPYDIGFGTLLGEEPISPQSEDCLTMDIHIPDGDLEGLPVYCS